MPRATSGTSSFPFSTMFSSSPPRGPCLVLPQGPSSIEREPFGLRMQYADFGQDARLYDDGYAGPALRPACEDDVRGDCRVLRNIHGGESGGHKRHQQIAKGASQFARRLRPSRFDGMIGRARKMTVTSVSASPSRRGAPCDSRVCLCHQGKKKLKKFDGVGEGRIRTTRADDVLCPRRSGSSAGQGPDSVPTCEETHSARILSAG